MRDTLIAALVTLLLILTALVGLSFHPDTRDILGNLKRRRRLSSVRIALRPPSILRELRRHGRRLRHHGQSASRPSQVGSPEEDNRSEGIEDSHRVDDDSEEVERHNRVEASGKARDSEELQNLIIVPGAIFIPLIALLATVVGIAILEVVGIAILAVEDEPREEGRRFLETATCSILSARAEGPTVVEVGQPFEVSLTSLLLDASDDVHPACPVTASLTGEQADLSYGEPQLNVDLALARPNWSVVANRAGRHTLFVSVNSTTACTAACEVPAQFPLEVVATASEASQDDELVLQAVVEGLHVYASQNRPLEEDTPGVLQVEVTLPSRLALGDFDEVRVGISSPSGFLSTPEGARLVDLLGQPDDEPLVQEFDVSATPDTARDLRDQISVHLSGVRDGETTEVVGSYVVRVDVAEKSWFRRVVVDNATWFSAAVACMVTLGGIAVAVVGRIRNRRSQPSRNDDESDHARYL